MLCGWDQVTQPLWVGQALSFFLNSCGGVLSAGVWLGSARSFLMTGKTQVRQKWTLAIPGEQAGRHLPISSFLVSGSPLVPSGPSRERGVCGLSHSLCPQGLLGGIKEVV